MALPKMLRTVLTTAAIVALLLTLITIGVLGSRGGGKARTMNVGLYSDSGCMIDCSSINWENINPGGVIERTIYIKNSGDTAITLDISTNSWNPKWAKSMVTLSWNLGNYLLSAGEVVPATLTLAIAPDTGSLANFNFIIVISGTQK